MNKEHPILFSSDMVRAILDGRKSMTRRIVKLPKGGYDPYWSNDNKEFLCFEDGWGGNKVKCPFEKIGDYLWVREKWKLISWDWDGEMCIEYADGQKEWVPTHDPTEDSQWQIDKTNNLLNSGFYTEDPEDEENLTRTDKVQPFSSPIFMPKEACRIWLQITDIKVERLQDISEEDVVKEGCTQAFDNPGSNTPWTAKTSFELLWQSINGEESWNQNPWVWAISFSKINKP